MPKQLIPFIRGKSLIQIARDRLDGLVDPARQFICAGLAHRDAILQALDHFSPDNYLAEPTGRDTLNAVAFGAAVIHQIDPEAVVAVFTADHIIEPVNRFQSVVSAAYELAESQPETLVTFGITPTHPATGFGYLQLGRPIRGDARIVDQFKEKPDAATAQRHFDAGPAAYLWNSGMFVWRAATVLDCIRRYEPANYEAIMRIARAWRSPDRDDLLHRVYPTLKKISVDYAVMEPASKDPAVQVAALPMPLTWLDVGSWPAFAKTCDTDSRGNALGPGRHLLLDTQGTLAASSDEQHLIAAIGCDNLIIIHTPHATLVCPANCAEKIKDLHAEVADRFGDELL